MDNCEIAAIYVVDSASGTEWGPYEAGMVFQYVEDASATPTIVVGTGSTDWKITGNGPVYIKAVDASGNESDQSNAWCEGATIPAPTPAVPDPTTAPVPAPTNPDPTPTTATPTSPPGAGGDPHFWVGFEKVRFLFCFRLQ